MTLGFAHGAVDKDVSAFCATLDRADVHRELERVCVSEWECGAPEAVSVEPLRAHQRRCTLKIALTIGSGRRELIAKVYTDDRSDVFHAMRAVSRAGFGGGSAFSIPQPFAWLPALGVRLEEKIEGRFVKEVIVTGSPGERTTAAERCGQWLGRFHRAAPRPENGRDLVAKLAHNRAATARMTSLRPKAEILLRQLDEAVPLAAAVPRCAGHGSYIPDHVILCARRTVAIDLDEYDAADPSRDVAWFLVALQRRAIQLLGSRHALDGAADAFIHAYVASGPPAALANLPLYRALVCLSRARRDLYKQTPELAEFMLDEALRHLSH